MNKEVNQCPHTYIHNNYFLSITVTFRPVSYVERKAGNRTFISDKVE